MTPKQELYGEVNLAVKHIRETCCYMEEDTKQKYINVLKQKINMLDSRATQEYLLSILERRLETIR